MRFAADFVLRLFGYARVPREAAELADHVHFLWQRRPDHPRVGEGLRELAKLLDSATR